MDSLLLHYLSLWKPLAYGAAFVGMIFEGDVVVFTSFFLLYQRFFSFFAIVPVLFAGSLLGDFMWWCFGIFIRHLPKMFHKWVHYVAEPFDVQLFKRPWHLLFLAKFTYGLRHALLMRSAMLGMPFKKILFIDVVTTAVWMAILGSLGYFSGASFEIVRKYLRYAEVVVLLIFLAFLSIQHVVIRMRLAAETKNGQ